MQRLECGDPGLHEVAAWGLKSQHLADCMNRETARRTSEVVLRVDHIPGRRHKQCRIHAGDVEPREDLHVGLRLAAHLVEHVHAALRTELAEYLDLAGGPGEVTDQHGQPSAAGGSMEDSIRHIHLWKHQLLRLRGGLAIVHQIPDARRGGKHLVAVLEMLSKKLGETPPVGVGGNSVDLVYPSYTPSFQQVGGLLAHAIRCEHVDDPHEHDNLLFAGKMAAVLGILLQNIHSSNEHWSIRSNVMLRRLVPNHNVHSQNHGVVHDVVLL
mmetsp:Transcript_95552/g.255497  ORF Transcript_95552/g.255497 Transcript_95552/m.255497 type:complete len:269 (-) Transcript_95552:897-1703(-)